MTSPPATEQRAGLQDVTAAAVAELAATWPNLLDPSATTVRDALRDLVPLLADDFGAQAGALAVDTYAVLRDAADVGGSFTPRPGPTADLDAINRMIGWAVDPLFSADPNAPMALYRVTGGLQKIVADEYRGTMQQAAIDDPRADGWQREARAGGCPFCVMLAGRGAVYSKKTVDFGAHRDCHCLAVPAFTGQPKPVREYTPTNRNITAADRAAVRRWIAEHQ